MSIEFTKMEGCGNDYVYVDARDMDHDWPALSIAMSDRHFGIGSDGLILIMDSDRAALKMRMFNADGSEGEMCGNGIRCFTKFAIERNIAAPTNGGLTVETLGGVRTVRPYGENGQVTRARVAMGEPILAPMDVPVVVSLSKGRNIGDAVADYPLNIDGVDLKLTFVSMGNPHAVAFIDTPVEDFPLHTIGPKVEHHPIFPNRVNFEIVNRIGRNRLNARVWERGSGETMACGSGACAMMVAANLHGFVGSSVDISLPGGTLTIDWDGRGEVFLEGPATEVFSGHWPT